MTTYCLWPEQQGSSSHRVRSSCHLFKPLSPLHGHGHHHRHHHSVISSSLPTAGSAPPPQSRCHPHHQPHHHRHHQQGRGHHARPRLRPPPSPESPPPPALTYLASLPDHCLGHHDHQLHHHPYSPTTQPPDLNISDVADPLETRRPGWGWGWGGGNGLAAQSPGPQALGRSLPTLDSLTVKRGTTLCSCLSSTLGRLHVCV